MAPLAGTRQKTLTNSQNIQGGHSPGEPGKVRESVFLHMANYHEY